MPASRARPCRQLRRRRPRQLRHRHPPLHPLPLPLLRLAPRLLPLLRPARRRPPLLPPPLSRKHLTSRPECASIPVITPASAASLSAETLPSALSSVPWGRP